MSTQLALYESIPAASCRKLERCAAAIDKAKASGVALIFDIGKQLQIAHAELANHGDGKFGKWVVDRCGITHQTALNYLRAVESFAGQDLKTVFKSFDATAVYYLSRDTTPEEAIKDAVKAAKKGERVTLAKAEKIVGEYTVDESKSEPEPPDFDELEVSAMKKVRAAFAAWPEEYLIEVPTVLKVLLQEDHKQWKQSQ